MNTAYFIQQIEQQQKEQDSIYHNVAVHFGLSDTVMWVLYLISENDETLTQQDLCRQVFFAKQTIHTAINALAKNGLVKLVPIPGTRNHKRILLTAAGQKTVDATVNRLKAAEQQAYGKLTQAELQSYLEMTHRLTEYLRDETGKLIREEADSRSGRP